MILMSPKSFDSLALDGSAGISSATFELPYPNMILRHKMVAGGYIVDFDYGTTSKVVPSPFGVLLYFESSTAAGLGALVDSLLAPVANGGKMGKLATFVATEHGSSTLWSCSARISTPGLTIGGANFGPSTKKLSRVPVTVHPVDLFALVV